MLAGIVLVGIILANILAANFPVRVDLTEDQRYTITDATKQMLENLEDVVYVEVYLEGDFPPGFQRLQKAVRDKLEEFRIYGGRNIQYKFIDPTTAKSGAARNTFYQSLAEKGIQPTNVFDDENGKKTEKLIFPGAVISYGDREKAAMLLKGNMSASSDERLNQSVEGVEYELASALRQVTAGEKSKIALIKGQGEIDSLSAAGLTNTLLESFDVFHVTLSNKLQLTGYDAIIIAKPTIPFTEPSKYKLDQYLMAGGNILFFIDAMGINPDSVGNSGTFAFPMNLNLDNQLFTYGARINNNLIQDLTSGRQPMVVGNMGDQPQVQLIPWPFYPLINKFGDHPIVKNLNAVATRYISSIDTVKAVGVTKTPLLFTSSYSRQLSAPVRVNINDMRQELNPQFFNQGSFPVAYLFEGKFNSVFKNRVLPPGVDKASFVAQGLPAKIMLAADGDMVRNEINPRTGQPFPLGFDPYAQYTFSNPEFLLNTLQYMLDDRGIIAARAKEIKIRPLDMVKVNNERTFWQIFNLVLPVLVILIVGIIIFVVRRRRFTQF